MKEKALEKFLRYISINTQSKEESDTFPSTKIQFDLAKILVDELKELGLQDVSLDDHCYVMATLPSNIDKDVPIPEHNLSRAFVRRTPGRPRALPLPSFLSLHPAPRWKAVRHPSLTHGE